MTDEVCFDRVELALQVIDRSTSAGPVSNCIACAVQLDVGVRHRIVQKLDEVVHSKLSFGPSAHLMPARIAVFRDETTIDPTEGVPVVEHRVGAQCSPS